MNRENLYAHIVYAHIDCELITAVHLGTNTSKKAKSTTNATIVSCAKYARAKRWVSAVNNWNRTKLGMVDFAKLV